jgi:hypothetical protein
LAASFISKHTCDVAYWHLADNPTAPAFVRYWIRADNRGFSPVMVCPLMTHKRHSVLKAQINKTDRNDARGIAQMMRRN